MQLNKAYTIFNALCDTAPTARDELLDKLCGDNSSLKAEVRRLLLADAKRDDKSNTRRKLFIIDELPEFPELKVDQVVGDFTIVEKCGEGGMGVVYRARQHSLNRDVALKVIRPGWRSTWFLERFEDEKKTLAKCRHIGIAQIYDAGTYEHGGQKIPFITMQYVEGENLLDYVKQHECDDAEKLRLLIRICEPVKYAHGKGVVHLDLKPSNIIVDTTATEPNPTILDFGMAREVGTDAVLLHADDLAGGTLAYMSPERLTPGAQVDAMLADIYSIGVICFELLTETRPYPIEGKATQETRETIVHSSPLRLTQIRRHKNMCELEAIVSKAMHKEAAERYQSVAELSEDIDRYLKHRPIEAFRPHTKKYVLGKWIRRHWLLSIFTCVVIVLLIGLVSGWVSAIHNLKLATDREATAQRHLYSARSKLAQQAWENNDVARTIDILSLMKTRSQGEDLRSFEWYHMYRLCHEDIRTINAHGKMVASVAFIADGKILAAASRDQTVSFWKLDNFEKLRILRGIGPIPAMAVSPVGSVMVTSGLDLRVIVWDTDNGNRITSLNVPGYTCALAYDVSGCIMVSGSTDGQLRVWDTTTWTMKQRLDSYASILVSLVISRQGDYVIAAHLDGTIRKWHLRDSTCNSIKPFSDANLSALTMSPDGLYLAAGFADGSVLLLDASTYDVIVSLTGHTGTIESVIFNPDGKILASAGRDQTVRLWNVETKRMLGTYKGHTHWIRSVAFAADSQTLVTGSYDGSIKLWYIRDEPYVEAFKTYYPKASICISTNPLCAAALIEHTVRIWNNVIQKSAVTVVPASFATTLPSKTLGYSAITILSDGHTLAVGGNDGAIELWELADRHCLGKLQQSTVAISWLSAGRDNTTLFAGDAEGNMVVWDISHKRAVTKCALHVSDVRAVMQRADDTLLVLDGYKSSLRLYQRPGDMSYIEHILGVGRAVHAAFMADGSAVVLSDARSVRICRVQDGSELMPNWGGVGEVKDVAVSPDGRCLAICNDTTGVVLLDAAIAQERILLQQSGVTPVKVAFSRDGCVLAGVTKGGNLIVWDAPAKDALVQTVASPTPQPNSFTRYTWPQGYINQCGDGLDNDNDGLVDLADQGCRDQEDDDESNATSQCQDSRDNDGDGYIDYPDDPGCSSRQDNSEWPYNASSPTQSATHK